MRFSSRRSPDRGGVPSGTRLPLRLGIAGAVALSALLLGGCVQPAPVKTPQAHATVKPLFASDADALAAATKAYGAYLKMSDTISQEGGADPERLAPLVTTEWLKKEIHSYETFAASDRRQIGEAAVRNAILQNVDDRAQTVTTYFCTDISNAHFVDSEGVDVTPTSRQGLVSLEVMLKAVTASDAELVISEVAPWSGTAVC
jgi:outer membrane murein-binding lipoprotein Lpp